jgi:hypothetical protein
MCCCVDCRTARNVWLQQFRTYFVIQHDEITPFGGEEDILVLRRLGGVRH